jgi:hypothetical protein
MIASMVFGRLMILAIVACRCAAQVTLQPIAKQSETTYPSNGEHHQSQLYDVGNVVPHVSGWLHLIRSGRSLLPSRRQRRLKKSTKSKKSMKKKPKKSKKSKKKASEQIEDGIVLEDVGDVFEQTGMIAGKLNENRQLCSRLDKTLNLMGITASFFLKRVRGNMPFQFPPFQWSFPFRTRWTKTTSRMPP